MRKKKEYKDLSALGFDIKQSREKKKISQPTAAKYCGVSVVAFSRWEAGVTKKIESDHFLKLKELLA